MLPKIKMPRLYSRLVALFLVSAGAGSSLGLVAISARESSDFESYLRAQKNVPVKPPGRMPEPSQHDIDIALALYSVAVPSYLEAPKFDPDIEDRGLTTGSTLHGPRAVFVGPAAFVSWAVLGSTLAHEVEVHGRQDFFSIVLQDEVFRFFARISRSGAALAIDAEGRNLSVGRFQSENYGTWKAEREAYNYEIENAERFGLSSEELRLIKEVMETYYPEKN